MASNNSDYKKPFSNIQDLLPNVFRSDVSKALTHNGFDRFLTKIEMQDVVGTIGDGDFETQITEVDSHRQANQLQPLIYNRIATVDHISSFKDILRESERLGVDITRFAEWGDALRFNFAPPVDLDKLVNYRDYYWLNDTTPQYITIKNRARKLRTILNQAYSDFDGLRELVNLYLAEEDPVQKAVYADDINALYPDLTSMIDELEFNQLANPLNQTNPDGWDAIDYDPLIDGEWGNPFEGLDIVGVTQSAFTVEGDFADLFNIQPLFDFQVIDSSNNSGIFQVAIAVYDQNTNKTQIFVDGGGLVDAVVDGKIAVSLFDYNPFDPFGDGNYDIDDGSGVESIPNPQGFQLQNDQWSQQNYWVHLSDIPDGVNLSLVRQATQPIIEYNEFLVLNSWSYVQHNWNYNPGNGFVGTGFEPTQEEIFADRDSTFPVVDVDPLNKTITLDPSFEAEQLFTVGKEISIEIINTSSFKYYVIENVAVDGTGVITITLDQQLPGDITASQIRLHALRYTSQGDDWKGFFTHWVYEGAESPVPVSAQELNPNLIPSDPSFGEEFEIIPATGISTVWYRLSNLDYRPHNDEIRVYVNDVRQYGNYLEGYWDGSQYTLNIPQGVRANAIRFLSGVGSGNIRIEVGPSAAADARLASVNVRISTDASYTVEDVSLIRYRIVEQQKTEITQYPLFDIFNLDGTTAYRADPIWRFVESGEYDVNTNVNKRIAVNGTVYQYEQTLLDYDDGPMYAYQEFENVNDSTPILRTIWRKGLNDERYVPEYVNSRGETTTLNDADGDWKVPDQMFHNLEHQNRRVLSSVDLYQHFKTIIESQDNPPGYTSDARNRWRVLPQPNFGLGGSINEFNDGFDTFISSTFVEGVTVSSLLSFVQNRYDNQLNLIEDSFESSIDELLNDVSDEALVDFEGFVTEFLVNRFENNNRRDIVFGDSLTYNEETQQGIRGWISTTPFIGLSKPTKPKLLVDKRLGLIEITHHDGHISTPSFNNGRISLMIGNALKDGNAVSGTLSSRLDSSQAPRGQVFYATDTKELYKHILYRRGSNTPQDAPVGAYWFDTVNNVVKQNTTSGFVVVDSDAAWKKIDLSVLHASVVLDIENRLYSAVPDIELNYDITQAFNDPDYSTYEQQQFISFTKEYNLVNPYVGDYNSANSFTWNYSSVPTTNTNVSTIAPVEWNGTLPARWYDIYKGLYGTRYPHLEPWVLQGYSEKPVWWDSEYVEPNRRWSLTMWQNIISGIVPAGYEYANGNVSLGTTTDGALNGNLKVYNAIPVNVTSSVSVEGGYGPDDLLPPYFNSNDPADSAIVSFGAVVAVPPSSTQASAMYPFGTNGPIEDTWRRSSEFLYDLIETNFLLQPVRFMHYAFGNNFNVVDGLTVDVDLNKVFSHRDVKFHGEIVNGSPIRVSGLNQWYVNYMRFKSYDLQTSDFKTLWIDWRPRLAYQSGSFIDDKSMSLSTDSQFFDSSDYTLLTKKTPGLADVYIDSLKMVVNEVGSYRMLGGLRIPNGDGSDWKFRITTPNPSIQNIRLYGVNTNAPEGSFTALKGQTTNQTWTRYAVDRSTVHTFTPGDVVSNLGVEFEGIQGLVNFITGYAAYLEDAGFKFNSSEYPTFDTATGRTFSWQLETEKMIDQIYNGMASDQLPVEFYGLWNYVYADVNANHFIVTGSKPLALRNDDQVQLSTTGNLPAPFKRESVYYVVNVGTNTFQLSQIRGGTPINIQTAGQGVHSVGMNRFEVASPATLYEINPFRTQVIVQHPIGVLANVHNGSFTDIRMEQGVYDQYGRPLKPHYVNVFRQDQQSRIIIEDNIPNDVIVSDPIDPDGRNLLHVGGMHLFMDGYEHAIMLNSRSIEGNLLFDEFLGSSIRKINARFRRQTNPTFRPNVGGYIVDDDSLRMNFEGSVEQIQHLYDAHLADENSEPVEAARGLIGFERKDYFDNMGITPKSQLLFHRGVIQHKGSTNAVKAFINSKRFIDASVDEFWAYKVAEYGDNRKAVYPELNLTPRDTFSDKLMLEFLVDQPQPQQNFIGVTLSNMDRWYNQPAQLKEVFGNNPNLFFDAEVTDAKTITGTEATVGPIEVAINDEVSVVVSQKENTGQFVADNSGLCIFYLGANVIPQTDCLTVTVKRDDQIAYNQNYVLAPDGSFFCVEEVVWEDGTVSSLEAGDIVSYSVQNAKLVRDVHYRHINAQFISFDVASALFDITDFEEIHIYSLNPAKTKLNPVKFIDYASNTLVETIPIWDPARGHHYHVAENIVSYQEQNDPAFYTNSLVGFKIDRNRAWESPHVGDVWWDTSNRDYVPYYDDAIYSTVDRRTSEWGRLAEYGSIDLYEWIESSVPPSEYASLVEESDGEIQGKARLELYARDRNTGSGEFDQPWYKIEDVKHSIWAHSLTGTQINVSSIFSDGDILEVYINGIDTDRQTVVGGEISIPSYTEHDKIVLIKRAYVPTEEELEFDPDVEDDPSINTQYRYDADYVVKTRIADNGIDVVSTYYFWATETSTAHDNMTLTRAKQQLSNIPTPFVIFQNLLASERYESDNGVVMLPNRYTQAIFRGMVNYVSAENRYKLRFTKNFGLRDDYEDAQPYLRQRFNEWKMIRRGQKFNVDKVLWDKLTEAMSGRTLSDDPTPVPSLNRVLYDEEMGTTLRYGLRDGQSFVPAERGIDVVIKSIQDPNFDLYPIDREEFLSTYSFDTPENIETAMNAIYTTFLPEHVNRIWFAALYEGLANNIKYTDIFKTSWIQLDGVRLLDTSGVLE